MSLMPLFILPPRGGGESCFSLLEKYRQAVFLCAANDRSGACVPAPNAVIAFKMDAAIPLVDSIQMNPVGFAAS